MLCWWKETGCWWADKPRLGKCLVYTTKSPCPTAWILWTIWDSGGINRCCLAVSMAQWQEKNPRSPVWDLVGVLFWFGFGYCFSCWILVFSCLFCSSVLSWEEVCFCLRVLVCLKWNFSYSFLLAFLSFGDLVWSLRISFESTHLFKHCLCFRYCSCFCFEKNGLVLILNCFAKVLVNGVRCLMCKLLICCIIRILLRKDLNWWFTEENRSHSPLRQ